jgi:hypothetical protein
MLGLNMVIVLLIGMLETKKEATPKLRKKKISPKLREEVWIHHLGPIFSAKCPIVWCTREITVFNFESGHNIPESKGGATSIENLIPICAGCNRGMSDQFTIDEYSRQYAQQPKNESILLQSVEQEVILALSPPLARKSMTSSIISYLRCFSKQTQVEKIVTEFPKTKASMRDIFTNELSLVRPS